MLQVISGLYKRAGRKPVDAELVVHAELVIPDTRGRKIGYHFGIRADDAARGLVVTMRSNNFVPGFSTETEVDEKAMSLDGWYFNPASVGDFLLPVEKIEDARILAFAVANGSKPLADYVVEAIS